MNKSMSAFMAWAREQFGARPGGTKSTETLRVAANACRRDYSQAQAIYEARVAYDQRLDTALLGWNARQP